jgi:hypothetical protein
MADPEVSNQSGDREYEQKIPCCPKPDNAAYARKPAFPKDGKRKAIGNHKVTTTSVSVEMEVVGQSKNAHYPQKAKRIPNAGTGD